MQIQLYIERLERFSMLNGVAVMRRPLDAWVCGHIGDGRMILCPGLSEEEQLLTLVHELTHLLVHRRLRPWLDRTVCEYEAEATERLFAAKVRLHGDGGDFAAITDDLLPGSVRRVRFASHILVDAATEQVARDWPCGPLQAQPSVHI